MAKKRRVKKRKKVKVASAERRLKEHDSGFAATIKPPDGVEVFTFGKQKSYSLDIVPYELTKSSKKFVRDLNFADIGYYYYERTYYRHNNIGTDKKSMVCPALTFGKKCPICEYRDAIAKEDDPDSELLKDLKPKQRQLFLIRDRNNEEAGVQILEAPFYFGLGEMIEDRIGTAEPNEIEDYQSFYDPEGGFFLKIAVKPDTFNGRTFNKPTTVDFKDRKNGLDPDTLDASFDLDAILVETPYKKMKSIFLQDDQDDPEEDETEEEDDDVEQDDTEEEEEEEEDDDFDPVEEEDDDGDESEDSEEEDDDDEDAPFDVDEDEDDDEPEDDEPEDEDESDEDEDEDEDDGDDSEDDDFDDSDEWGDEDEDEDEEPAPKPKKKKSSKKKGDNKKAAKKKSKKKGGSSKKKKKK